MALKIRLRQQGRNNRPSYRLVVTQVTAKRDGKYLEALGWYDPFIGEVERSVSLKEERLKHWLNVGAQLTEKAEALVARTSPALLQQYHDKLLAHKEKERNKRKARRQAAEG